VTRAAGTRVGASGPRGGRRISRRCWPFTSDTRGRRHPRGKAPGGGLRPSVC